MVGFPSHQPPPDAPSVPPAPPAPPASPAAAKAVTFTGIAQPEPQETSQVRCTPSNSAIDFTSEQPSPASHLALSIHPNDLYENEHSTGDSASPLGTWAAGIGDYRKNFGDALGILPEAHAPALYRMSMPSKVSRRGQIHETDEATALLPDLQGSTKDTPCVSDRKSSVNQAAPRTPDSANHNGGQSIHRRKTVGEAGLGCPFAAMAASGRMQSLEKRSLLKDGKGQRISARSLPQAYARSVATSVSKGDLSDVFGANKGLDELRLDFLDRDDWTHAEVERRDALVPLLRKTLQQLDGTIPSKLPASHGHGILEFGNEYFTDLFRDNPEMHFLFGNKPINQLSLKVILMMRELVRLQEMASPRHLGGALSELALMHIEYGVRDVHAGPFKASLLHTMRRVVQARGFRWSREVHLAWQAVLDETVGLLMQAVNAGRPRVEMLQRSWLEMCKFLFEADNKAKPNSKPVSVKSSSTRVPSPRVAEVPKIAALYTSFSHRKSDGLFRSYSNRRSPSLKKQTSIPTPRMLQRSASISSGFFGRLGSSVTLRNVVQQPSKTAADSEEKPGLLKRLLPIWPGIASKDTKKQQTRPAPGSSYWMESRGAAHGTGDSAYNQGKELVGRQFMHVFASRNGWVIERWGYGNGIGMAVKMGEMLETIVRNATRPEFLHHELRVLALKHTQMGVTADMFDDFEDALFDVLGQVLGLMEMWDREMQDSWRWLWGIVRGAFCRHMGNADLMLGKLEASWSILQDKREGLTTHFYEQLFNMAPHLESLFTKPQAMQHVMLQKALDMLVSGVRDPSVLQEEVKAIALRHIKYDITREDFTVFGEVLIGALRNAAGPCDWDDETEKAWHDIYSHTTQAFRHVLSSGKNLVCQALLSCCTKQLRHALESTPRGQRIQAVLEIQIDDRTMSPITWSVVEGHTHLTELLLEDVLAIRSDRNCYYYGRSALWKACPWLMPLLVEKAPKVLPVLLDGHLWCSRFVECGTRRVNYYIKEMYGNPHIPEQAVVFNSPLAILVHKLPMTELHTFSHPVITFLVNLKWRLFAKQWFISTQVLNIMNLASSTMFLHYGQNNTTASFALGLVTVTIAMLRLVLHVVVICQQIRTSSGSRVLNNRLLVPYALMDWYVILNIGSAVMCAVLFCFSFVADPFGWQALVKGQDASSLSPEQMLTRAERDLMRIWAQLAAFTTFMLWIEATEVFKLSTKLSALSYALIAVLSEVMRYMAFMALWVFGFGMTMYWLFVADINNYEYNTAPANRQDALKLNQELIHEDLTGTLYSSSLLYVLLLASLGFADIDLVIKSSWIVRAMFGLCVFATSVVLLNLLVAAMVTAYDYLQKNCDDLAMQCRAELVLRAEETMRIGRRIAIFDSLGMDEPCEFDTGDNGPSGAVQVREKIDSLSHPAFENLDRVQRFSGTTNPDAPWDPSKCHTQHRTRRTRSSGNVANNLECLETTIQTQMAYIQQELFRMQQGANDSMDSGCDQDGFSPKPDDLRIDIGDRGLELGCAKGNGNSRTNMTGSSLRASDDDALEDHESGRQERREVSAEELADHDTEESLWVAIDGEVYDITSLLAFHPGGRKLLLVTGGTDITRTFMTTHKGPSLTAASGVLRSMQHIGKYMPMQ